MKLPEPTYKFYTGTYGGVLPETAFDEALPAARRHVRWLCGGHVPCRDEVCAYKRALCATIEVFAAYGQGPATGFQIGDFRLSNSYANEFGGTAEDIATRAALQELAGCRVAFSGVC